VLSEVSTADGAYVAADGDYQATAGRAIQPRVLLDLPEDATNGPVHGIVVRGGTYEDTEPFDPVISRPQQEWDVNAEEPQVCLDAYWPSVFTLVNSLSSPQGLLQKAVVIPGQFRCTSGNAPTVTGQQRIYNTLELSTRRSTSADFEPPALGPDGLRIVDNGEGQLRVTVDAFDDSGIAEIIAYVLHGGDLVVAESGPLTGDGPFSVDIPIEGSEGERLVVQIVDGAGNVSTLTGKGVNLHIVRVDAGPDQAAQPGAPSTLTATVFNFDVLIGETNDISYTWEFGDGSFEGGLLAVDGVPEPLVTLGPDGTAHFEVQHQYGDVFDNIVTTLTVSDGLGGIGADDATVTPSCGSGADPDGDGLMSQMEASIGTDPCNRDTDGDQCSDGAELGNDPSRGGLRDPLDFWDFFDVGTYRGLAGPGDEDFTPDGRVTLMDVLIVLDHFGHDGLDPQDHLMDRRVDDSERPWATAEETPGDRVRFDDAIAVLYSIGHACS
jgi:hypothetical protein